MLAQILPKQGHRRAIFNNFTHFFFFFFQNYNMITQYVPTYLTKNQQKKSTVGGIKG